MVMKCTARALICKKTYLQIIFNSLAIEAFNVKYGKRMHIPRVSMDYLIYLVYRRDDFENSRRVSSKPNGKLNRIGIISPFEK